MNHIVKINKLGPIDHCELECSKFMTFTGMQASGKSTISKVIYYFRTIREDIFHLAEQQALSPIQQPDASIANLRRALENLLREKFLRVFGSSYGMDNEMYLEYHFTDSCFVTVSLKEDARFTTPNYVWFDFSPELYNFLNSKNGIFSATELGVSDIQKQRLKNELKTLFADPYSVVFIPAGRSMITLLSQQLSYIYTTMKDSQKRTLDYCTQDYIERILSLKPEFSEGLEGLPRYRSGRENAPQKSIRLGMQLIDKVLRGSYRFCNGEERIIFDRNHYVKINFSSSGQQESVWILNLLFYYLVQNEPVLFIIEEPESHLFPESQKYITELIALVNNNQHSMVVTTHSPYVLGTLNNLLYASSLKGVNAEDTDSVIPRSLWLDDKFFRAWFVREGKIENCMDEECHLIQNEKIDEISKVINQDFDRLLELQLDDGEGR
ncbi:MAG: ATP-binding protein [Lachnospiraceae bacterium]|nr:ATP-binding protein [Lachnospiraceae bacterium]